MKLPMQISVLLCAGFLALVRLGVSPTGAQPPAPRYAAPTVQAVRTGAAPLRVLAVPAQTMLAWKGDGAVRVVAHAERTVLYTAPAGESVGIARETPDRSAALRKANQNFAPVADVIRLESDKPIQLWTPTPNAWTPHAGPLIVTPTADGRFSVAREMLLEEYLRNVAPAEMPASFHAQALRAQAIIARTYTLQQLGRHAEEGADLCATVHCQAFAAEARRTKATDDAVADTRGIILLDSEKPADTYYHSCCGGATDDAGYVWGPAYTRRYLAGGADVSGKPPAEGDVKTLLARKDQYCQHAGNARWSRQFSASEVNALVKKNLALVTGDATVKLAVVTNMAVEERTPHGRAATLRVEGDGASVLVYGDKIRWLFGNGQPGPEGLWSTLFDLTLARDTAGNVTGYTFTGAGRGHGLGLCQWGADGRAKAGQSYREILHAYYPGTKLSK